MELWYKQPAQDWTEALPAGNGRLGCMVFGGVAQETFCLNEDSLWNGGAMHRTNPAAAGVLPKVRELLRCGQIPQAEQLALDAMSAAPSGMRAYQPLGTLDITTADLSGDVQAYRRALNLERGLLTVSFSCGGWTYKREIFISYPDQVLAARFSTDNPAGMNFSCRLSRPRCDTAGAADAATTYFAGDSGGIGFACAARLMEGEGENFSVSALGDTLRLHAARSAVLCICAATTYRESEPLQKCLLQLESAQNKGYAALLSRHLADVQQNFTTMRLTLPSAPDTDALPADVRLQRLQAGAEDAGLEALYFQYSRWLLFSSSRPGSLPANLQGIWNDSFFPPWDAKFTININLEMNYWPANSCGLSTCEEPLFDLLARMLLNGQHTAQSMYHCRGFVAHHNTDLWGDTDPQDRYVPATFWPMGAAWLCTHIWNHYLYSGSLDFLQENFPVLEQAVLFFTDFLEQDEDGFYITSPSVSPENTYTLPDGTAGHLCRGPAMDNQILRQLFTQYLAAAALLQTENDITRAAQKMLSHIHAPSIGKDGRLLEWAHEYREAEPGHRHISHLYALAPGHEISPRLTPELAAAAEKTLCCRLAHGGGHTGWSRAWICLFWAYLERGELFDRNLHELLADSTFPNLMDSHPYRGGRVFQIDGNLGAAAAIADSLVQTLYDGAYPCGVVLLPALPPTWHYGSVQGLCLPGGVCVDMSWADNALQQVTFHARRPWRFLVCYGSHKKEVSLTAGQTFSLTSSDYQ